MKKPFLVFDKETFEQFVSEYERCLAYQRQSFAFEGENVLADYAKYVIEYLEPKFNEKNNTNTDEEQL